VHVRVDEAGEDPASVAANRLAASSRGRTRFGDLAVITYAYSRPGHDVTLIFRPWLQERSRERYHDDHLIARTAALDYHCIVCIKQVPDTAHVTADAMKEDGTINRSALPAIINPDDLHALEAGLAVREQHGGTVTVITMGPLGAAEALRECLYRGADRAVLINDRRAAASDTLATSYILSQAVRKIGTYDLVFCGRQAIDGDTAQVGPQMAEKLGS
jgi:hypothetical protein